MSRQKGVVASLPVTARQTGLGARQNSSADLAGRRTKTQPPRRLSAFVGTDKFGFRQNVPLSGVQDRSLIEPRPQLQRSIQRVQSKMIVVDAMAPRRRWTAVPLCFPGVLPFDSGNLGRV